MFLQDCAIVRGIEGLGPFTQRATVFSWLPVPPVCLKMEKQGAHRTWVSRRSQKRLPPCPVVRIRRGGGLDALLDSTPMERTDWPGHDRICAAGGCSGSHCCRIFTAANYAVGQHDFLEDHKQLRSELGIGTVTESGRLGGRMI